MAFVSDTHTIANLSQLYSSIWGKRTQHGAAGAASASGPCAAWPGIGKLLLLISGSSSTDRSSRSAGRSGRGRSADAGTAGRGGAIGG